MSIRFKDEPEPTPATANKPQPGKGIRFARGEFSIGKRSTAVAEQTIPQTMIRGEASIEELLDEFGGAEAIGFFHQGYTLAAARDEHRQMMRRTPSERRLVRV